MLDVVVKVGGSLLAALEDLDATLDAIARLATARRTLVVPGGGPFADAVRSLDRSVGLSDDAAHWMAVLGMDQYAHLLADRLAGARIVTTLAGAAKAVDDRRVPVLSPWRWLRHVDPLPHSWDVTSDSIAAWVAGQAGAGTLVLVKARGATGELTDPYFAAACPSRLQPIVVAADRAAVLLGRLGSNGQPRIR